MKSKIAICHGKVNLKETNGFNLNLGRGRGNFTPCWFSLNNSETGNGVTLAFRIIQ